jgi:hypothetical protein
VSERREAGGETREAGGERREAELLCGEPRMVDLLRGDNHPVIVRASGKRSTDPNSGAVQ